MRLGIALVNEVNSCLQVACSVACKPNGSSYTCRNGPLRPEPSPPPTAAHLPCRRWVSRAQLNRTCCQPSAVLAPLTPGAEEECESQCVRVCVVGRAEASPTHILRMASVPRLCSYENSDMKPNIAC